MVTVDDKPFLQLCVAKRLIDQALARDVYRRAKQEGRSAGAVLIADGLMAAHTVQALEREVERLAAPRVIAGFRIVKKLGEGGMATVFLAEQLSLQREVALKLMSPQIANDAESAERFLREARIAAAVNHPNIVSVIDVGRHEGQLYLAMELVTGGDAAQLADRLGGVLPESRALEILIDCAEGLGALGDARLVHRDIKPSNIFLTKEGRAKLGDLGLARSEDGADRLTVTGFLVGTPAFMSPEQAGAADLVDIRSDIYALGATLFDLATGQQPYTGNGPIAVAAKVLTEPTPDPQLINPLLSSATAAVIRRAMAKKPEDRFQTPAELNAALRAALAGAQLQPPRTPTAPAVGHATVVTVNTGAGAVAQRRSLRGTRPLRPAGLCRSSSLALYCWRSRAACGPRPTAHLRLRPRAG